MKMQPEIVADIMYIDHCHADSRDVYPALQAYEAGITAADSRHDHILRSALLGTGATAREPYKQ